MSLNFNMYKREMITVPTSCRIFLSDFQHIHPLNNIIYCNVEYILCSESVNILIIESSNNKRRKNIRKKRSTRLSLQYSQIT
jgi:hypothetical protein